MESWKQKFIEEFNKTEGNINHIEFVNKYFNEIGSPTRNAAFKKVNNLLRDCRKAKENGGEVNSIVETTKIYEALEPVIVDGAWEHENTITFGLMGDTQFGSKYAQITYLHKFYDLCAKLGIRDIYHTGDISDGEKMRQGHEYDNYVHGADEHIAEIVKNYPMRPGVITHFITGNHDASFRKLCGVDIGKSLADKRSDLDYLGRDFAIVNITPNITLMLRHPWDGSAYALSYRPQKMIESMDEDTRPTILAIGHYHKMEYLYYLKVHCFQTGCFLQNTTITMADGSKKRISQIRVGDMVRTHTGETRRVIETYKRKFTGKFYRLKYGRNCANNQTAITATEEHPILVERHGQKLWVPIRDVVPGDYIFVNSKPCRCCGEPIPFYMNMCKICNPADLVDYPETQKVHKYGGGTSTRKHFESDILPYCTKLESQGWRVIPVGGPVVPDIVAVKDGKVALFEVENRHRQSLQHKKEKYSGADITNYVDEIHWVDNNPRQEQPRSWYEVDTETGYCKQRVVSNEDVTERNFTNYRNGKPYKYSYRIVYNFAVEGDNSYVASDVVVHNCFQGITPFTMGKGIRVSMGGWIVTLTVDKDGNLLSITPTAIPYKKMITDDYLNWRK